MKNLFLETQSINDFDTTVQKLSKEIERKSWAISNIYDLKATMEKHGKTVLPINVFSLCHPKFSSEILKKDYERIISSLMPCRVSVYEKSDGKTYISRMDTSKIAHSFGDVIEKVMTESFNEVEDIIAKVLQG